MNKSWIALGLLVLVSTVLVTNQYFKEKEAYNTAEKYIKDMNCGDLRMYAEHPDIIKVARHLTAPFGFCEDLVDLTKVEVCKKMENEKWEIVSGNTLMLLYQDRCTTKTN